MQATKSLIQAFNDAAALYANDRAIIDGDKTYSFIDIKIASDKFAAGLIQKGLTKGDRVALYCINGAEFAIAYMGIVKAGCVVVPINLLQKPTEISYVIRNADVSGIVYHDAFEANIEQLHALLDHPLFWMCISQDQQKSTAWRAAFNNAGVTPEIDIDVANDLVAILYTSGTTGHPKGAMLTHQNLVANTASVFEAMRWRASEDVIALVLPMFHAFAATVGMLTPLTHGCCFVPLPKFEPDKLLNVIEQTQSSVFLGVPSMYNVLLNLKTDNAKRFSSVRMCISGGASMPVDILNRFEKAFNVAIYEGDGPTECSPVTCVNPIGGVRKVGTVGLPVPGVEMRILNETGQQLPHGEIGEIAVRGNSVMKGYWKLAEATAESFYQDWFLTGDLGTEDDDGYFSILDRKKDMVIVNGMNVYPRIIEEVLYQYAPVLEAAVIGQVDDVHGEIPVAYIVLKEGAEASSVDIRAWCRQHLGNYEVPRKVVFLDALPKNGAGKIVKRVLNKQGEVERGIC